MPMTVERRLGKLIHEIKEIKKELILDKSNKVISAQNKINSWDSLGKKISCKWDKTSAVDEIIQQREKV